MIQRFHQNINVNFTYDVVFTRDLFTSNPNTVLKRLRNSKRVIFFIDEGVSNKWPHLTHTIENLFEDCSIGCSLAGIELVPGGERIKNDTSIVDGIGRIIRSKSLCRHSSIVAIGGGAVLDAIGFVSSISHRGIRLIRMPTTVLSMGDSGVGVKNGVNRFNLKNFYGSFYPPDLVICDLNYLKTNTDRVWISGISEAFKVGIVKNSNFLKFLITLRLGISTDLRQSVTLNISGILVPSFP